jgi:hypothetical protein
MSVGQQDCFDGSGLEAKPANEPFDEKRFSRHPRVNHHARIAIFKQMAAAHDAANRVQFVRPNHIE